jgi:CheY-like chemotaxis protein
LSDRQSLGFSQDICVDFCASQGDDGLAISTNEFTALTVLLIDDNKLMRGLVGETLRNLGVGNIAYAGSADEVSQRLIKLRPDVIICEWDAETSGGKATLLAVRKGATPLAPNTPFIALIGDRRASHVTKALADGCNSYVVKPFSAKVLGMHIEKAVAAHKAAGNVTYLD